MNDLHDSIRQEARKYSDVKELSNEDSLGIVDKIAFLYVNDRSYIHWWDSLKTNPEIIHYSNSQGLALAGRVVGQDDLVSHLFVTDDDPPPWPVFEGPLNDLLAIVGKQPYFEYILSDKPLSWIVFDTHHNCLVICGTLTETVKKDFV